MPHPVLVEVGLLYFKGLDWILLLRYIDLVLVQFRVEKDAISLPARYCKAKTLLQGHVALKEKGVS